jgi:thermitase
MKHHRNRLMTITPLILLFLAACSGSVNTPGPEQVKYNGGGEFDQLQTVSINGTDTPSSVAERTNGTIVSWHPEDKYAMVGVNNVIGLSATNIKAYSVAETSDPRAYGLAAWTEGWHAWGSGSTVWGSAWTVWGSGDTSKIPPRNLQIWQKIKLPEASKLAPRAGDGIKIAVIDSGIDLKHPAFQGSLVAPTDMWDWVDADAIPQDVSGTGSNHGYGHGTAVAGIIFQIAPKAKLMPLRVLNPQGEGDTANVIAAIDFAVAHGAKIINLSLGTSFDKSLDNTIKSANKAGVLVVAASGNAGNNNITYPANTSATHGMLGDMLVGVGSSELNNGKSSFSTYGYPLDMTAIGTGIATPAPGSMMASWSGTSMAAPMVSGGFALALAERSYTDLPNVGKTMASSGDSIDLNNPLLMLQLGHGHLNLERFLSTVLNPFRVR